MLLLGDRCGGLLLLRDSSARLLLLLRISSA
jgi:hypothetical protein